MPSSRPNPNHTSPFQYNLSDVFAITNPLGVPWHDISKKGQDFMPHFSYVGFHWDIAAKLVSVPEDKQFRALQKLTSVINADSLYLRDIVSILGTLQHLTFVYRVGHHALSSISTFLSKFPNKFVKHHLPAQAQHHLTWWRDLLLIPNVLRSLEPLPCLDPDIWVDASSSYRLGLVVGDAWATWQLLPGWNMNGHDIGWAKGIALEMAVYWLVSSKFHDADVIVHSDNTGVVGAFWKGWSQNAAHNDCISRISKALSSSNLSLSPIFVPSNQNRADPVSRGCLGTNPSCILITMDTPPLLDSLIQRV